MKKMLFEKVKENAKATDITPVDTAFAKSIIKQCYAAYKKGENQFNNVCAKLLDGTAKIELKKVVWYVLTGELSKEPVLRPQLQYLMENYFKTSVNLDLIK